MELSFHGFTSEWILAGYPSIHIWMRMKHLCLNFSQANLKRHSVAAALFFFIVFFNKFFCLNSKGSLSRTGWDISAHNPFTVLVCAASTAIPFKLHTLFKSSLNSRMNWGNRRWKGTCLWSYQCFLYFQFSCYQPGSNQNPLACKTNILTDSTLRSSVSYHIYFTSFTLPYWFGLSLFSTSGNIICQIKFR